MHMTSTSRTGNNERSEGQQATEDTSGSGKVAQAHNSAGDQAPTQTHQERRTPESRHDRESHVGSGNQNQSRQGSAGEGNRSARR
jgi:hypothetical protein